LVGAVFLFFMWVWGFYGCHKIILGLSCFLAMRCFSAPAVVWQQSFLHIPTWLYVECGAV
jgi:hypothetical protein